MICRTSRVLVLGACSWHGLSNQQGAARLQGLGKRALHHSWSRHDWGFPNVSLGFVTLKSPHPVTGTAQAGALTPTTSPSTSRLPSSTARPALDRLRIAFLLSHPRGFPVGDSAPSVDASASCSTPPGCGFSAPHHPSGPPWSRPPVHTDRVPPLSDGQNARLRRIFTFLLTRAGNF